MYVSTGLTPAARTRTTTCPADGDGSGASSSRKTSGPPNSCTRIAFIFAPSLAPERGGVVAREPSEGNRLTARDAPHVVRHRRGAARGEHYVELFERVHEPPGQAGRERPRAELLRGDGDVPDLPAGRLGELRRDVVVCERFRPGQHIGLPLVPALGERARGDGGDVAHVHEADARGADGLDDDAVGGDTSRLPEQVL